MGELKSKTLIKALSGAIIGMMISLTIFYFGGFGPEPFADRTAFCLQFLGSALNGAICMGSSIFYEIERWSLSRATLLHYIVCFCSFMIACFALHWFPAGVLGIVIAAFTVIYLLIWLTEYILWKREIRRINSELDQIQKKEKRGQNV